MGAVAQLGYLVFEVSDLRAWETFAIDVLGLELAWKGEGGSLALRNDSHAARLFLRPGPADDLAAIGWQVADEETLEEIVARIRRGGRDVTAGSLQLCALRHVRTVYRCLDPSGIPTELFCGPERAPDPFRSPVVPAGFVAEELGLGHLVVSSPNDAETVAFYRDALGFALSDRIQCEIRGMRIDLTFLHVNGRHHTLAFGGAQQKRLHHFMLEVTSLDDVGLAQDRVVRSRVARLAQTIGRHPNDRMVSFYAETPSGFQVEYGCGGRRIDEQWKPSTHHKVSEWGHLPLARLVRQAGPAAPEV